jgi:hypothetical protein
MINIKGSYVGNRQDGVEALDFFARGLIKAPFKVAPLTDLPKIYELMGEPFLSLFLRLSANGMQSKERSLVATSSRCPNRRFIQSRWLGR